MFHWEDGLVLTRAGLAIDCCRRQPRGFISHAHTDHIARHEYTLCTPATAALCAHRLGPRPMRHLPYRESVEWGGLRLTTYPAGHCLGSAMLLAEDGETSVLYTGDFKLGESATAERAELPHAETLIIESTYGDPAYRLPPRAAAIAQLCELVGGVLADGCTPVVLAYTLGKGQEVTRILTDAGFPVLQHKRVYDVSQVYEQCGVSLGNYGLLGNVALEGHVVVVPPGTWARARMRRPVRLMVSGWGIDPRAKYRYGVEHVVPLSDHADYDELFTAIEQVAPQRIYCTHGPVEFVDRLREQGLNAFALGRETQARLF